MISWIQRYFQQHFRILFAILLAVVIVSFVFTIGASGGIGPADRQGIDREFFGYNLSLAEDQQRLMGDAQLSVGLQYGAFAGLDPDQVRNYAFTRAAALHLADKWGIPRSSTADIGDAIKNLRMFAGQDGQFDAKAYQTFRDNLKTNPRGTSEADIARVIGDDIRVEKVNQLLAGPGYVLPADVKQQLQRFDTEWTLATATLDYESYKPEIKPTDAELMKWFEESGGRYDIPPRVVASYVEFPLNQFLPSVNVTDAEVRAFYDANPSRFPKPAEKPAGNAPALSPTPNPDADFPQVRAQVEQALKEERARRLAVKAASDLTVAMYERRVKPEEVESFLASRQVNAKPLAPFTRENGPAELGHSREIAEEAFKLNKDRFFSEAVATPNGAVVLLWKETQPSRKPLFQEVRDRVAADYVENERRKRFVELGRTLKSQLEARLKAGDSLEKAIAAVNPTGVKVETKTLPPFTLRNRPQDLDYSILSALERLKAGELSDLIITADKGIFVHAVSKKEPEVSETNPAYAQARSQLASISGRMGASAFISELVERELKRTEPKAE